MQSIRTAILVGLIAAILFFFYFAYAIAVAATSWAIHALAPALRFINATWGSGYSHFLVYAAAFVIGTVGTALFLLPIRIVWGITPASVLTLVLAISPVVLSTLSGGAPQTVEALSLILQPLAGIALLCVKNRSDSGR